MYYKVKNFDLDGMYVTQLDGMTDYTAEIIKWSDIPGMIECLCSDGEVRLIPSCQLVGFKLEDYPKDKSTCYLFLTVKKCEREDIN